MSRRRPRQADVDDPSATGPRAMEEMLRRREAARKLIVALNRRDSEREDVYTQCWNGRMPAEALSTADRGRLVSGLWEHGWTDVEIAAHTRMSTYTACRIREGLGLAVRTRQEGAA